MELDLQSLFGLHVHSYTYWLTPRNSPSPPLPRIWAHIRGRYWSAKIDNISLWPPVDNQSCSYVKELDFFPYFIHRPPVEGHRKGSLCTSPLPIVRCCGSGILCPFDPWIRDLGWVKNQDTNPGSGSEMNNPDHISESLETIWVKILKFFDPDPGSAMEWIRIRDPGWKKFESGINMPDPQHCCCVLYIHTHIVTLPLQQVVCGRQEHSVLVPERFVLCQNILYRAQTKCSFLYTFFKKNYLINF